MAAKPCLGYATRTDAVLALQAGGLSTIEIARKIGIPVATVSALAHSGLRTNKRRSQPDDPAHMLGTAMVLAPDILRSLRRHAARRGISVNRMAALIIETVLDDDMVDAVLDDAADLEQLGRKESAHG